MVSWSLTIPLRNDNFFGRGAEEEKALYNMATSETYLFRVEFGSALTAKIEGRSTITFVGGACRLGGCLQISKEVGIVRAVALAKKCKHTILVAGLNVRVALSSP